MDTPPSDGVSPQPSARRRRNVAVRFYKSGLVAGGLMLVAVGAVTTPTPVPVGILMVLAGLYFMARGSKSVRGGIKGLRRRLPRLSRALNAVKARAPAPMRRFIERSDPDR